MINNLVTKLNLYVDGKGYLGQVQEFTPPKIAQKMREYNAGGMAGAIDIPIGEVEKLEADFTLSNYDDALLKQFSVIMGASVPLRMAGALRNEDGSTSKLEINLRGTIREIDMGGWKPGDDVNLKITMSLYYYRLVHSGETLIEIDPQNMVLVVNGNDQLSGMRTALGI